MKLKTPVSFYQHAYSNDEVSLVLRAMKNENHLTQVNYLREFEKKICEILEVKDSFAVCPTTVYFLNNVVPFSLHYWLRGKIGYLCPPTKEVLQELRK